MDDTAKTAPWIKEDGYVPPHLRGTKTPKSTNGDASRTDVPQHQGHKVSDSVTAALGSQAQEHAQDTPLAPNAQVKNEGPAQVKTFDQLKQEIDDLAGFSPCPSRNSSSIMFVVSDIDDTASEDIPRSEASEPVNNAAGSSLDTNRGSKESPSGSGSDQKSLEATSPKHTSLQTNRTRSSLPNKASPQPAKSDQPTAAHHRGKQPEKPSRPRPQQQHHHVYPTLFNPSARVPQSSIDFVFPKLQENLLHFTQTQRDQNPTSYEALVRSWDAFVNKETDVVLRPSVSISVCGDAGHDTMSSSKQSQQGSAEPNQEACSDVMDAINSDLDQGIVYKTLPDCQSLFETIPGDNPNPRHFRIKVDPDVHTIVRNSNGWFTHSDPTMHELTGWDFVAQFHKRWVENIYDVPEQPAINRELYDPYFRDWAPPEVDHHAGSEVYADDATDHGREVRIPHWDCDVDTTTGDLMAPVIQPVTLPNVPASSDSGDGESGLHPQYWTSEYRIAIQMMKKQEAESSRAIHRILEEKRMMELSYTAKETDHYRLKFRKPRPVQSIKATCEFRPASLNDMARVAFIYNAEVKGPGMVPDSDEAPVTKFEDIFQSCVANNRPFIVAAEKEDHLGDASMWPDRAVFDEYMRWREESGKGGKAKILGFAYICPFDHGISSDLGNANWAAKLQVFVLPDQRRQGIGSALIDLMLRITVKEYEPKVLCEWVCPNPGNVYSFTAKENANRYRMLFVETYVKQIFDSNTDWKRRFIEAIFEFSPMCHVLGTYKGANPETDWLDKITWGRRCKFSDYELLLDSTYRRR